MSSVFLITSDGQTLRLPIPSQSPYDPLRWSLLKRSTVMGVISVFTVVGLVLVQGTSLLLSTLEMEYTEEVCHSHPPLPELGLMNIKGDQTPAARRAVFDSYSLLGNRSFDLGSSVDGNRSSTSLHPSNIHFDWWHIPSSSVQ